MSKIASKETRQSVNHPMRVKSPEEVLPFRERPAGNKHTANVSAGLNAHDLFGYFTADIIRNNPDGEYRGR